MSWHWLRLVRIVDAGMVVSMRLFAALPLSPLAVDRLTRTRLRLSSPGDGLRWSSPEQWHITLQFFGEISPNTANSLLRGLTERLVAQGPAVVEIAALETFAAKGILFAAVAASASLLALHEQVSAAAAECGILTESRAFRPHVTLARSKGKVGHKRLQAVVKAGLPSLGQDLRWEAREVQLLESTLGPQGAEYTLFGSVFLGAFGKFETVQVR